MASANTRLWRHVLLVAAVCLLNVCLVCEGAILPVAYKVGQQLRVEGNSYQTDERILPYDFYRMPQCKPPRAVISEYRASQSIGQIIMGSRPYPTSYIMTVGENITLCHNVCAVDFLPKHIRQGRTLLKNGYRGQFTLDGLPVLELRADGRYAEGYTVGQENHWNTHFTFTVMYTPAGGSDTDVYITGFFVEPRSVPCDEDTTGRVQLEDGIWRDEAVMLSYTLKWELDPDHTYETRWERYEHTIAEKSARKRGHWVSLVNSTCFVLLLGGVAAVIIAGTIRRDLALYAGDLADAVEDRGWKLLGGDVFRPPEQVVIFCGLLGSGAQIITLISLVFVAGGIHLLRISHRSGALLNGCIFFFFVASMVNGIVSGAMLKYFKKNTWRNGVQCVLLLPLSLSGGYMTLNMIYWIRRSSRAIPFSIVMFLICALVLCYVPMAILGLKMGFAKGVSSVEKVSAIPRMIPVVDSFAQAALLYLPGLVPFSAIFVEVTLVLSSMWKHETFYAAGVLCLMFFMVSLITAELSIVVTYARLCREDHRWWWGSFISCGSISIYLFLYSIVYLKMYLRIRSVSTIILYLGYMAGFSAIIGVTTGTIGVLCSYIFVKKLYIGQRVV